ncbi:hypothetical protein TNCV_856531 [Trichonephila clavipes]|nr:hypothetical protein TNCV_856531 [Trichonephila clavipes]
MHLRAQGRVYWDGHSRPWSSWVVATLRLSSFKKGCADFHSRRESFTCEAPTSFAEEDTLMPYTGFESESTGLEAEGHIHQTA